MLIGQWFVRNGSNIRASRVARNCCHRVDSLRAAKTLEGCLDYPIGLGLWVLLVAAPTIFAWLAGQRFGAHRWHQREDLVATLPDDRGVSHALIIDDLDPPTADPEGGLDPINALRANVDALRRSERIWDDPDVLRQIARTDPRCAEVLEHFRQSIAGLQMRDPGQVISLVPPEPRMDAAGAEA